MNRYSVYRCATFLAAFMLTSCNYYATKITDINYSGDDRSAAITLSDPQIFARETLINDRMAEHAYLEGQLKASETVAFNPDILREVENITTLSTQVGIAFDPTRALQFSQDKQVSNLQTQVNVAALQAQLALVQQQVKALQSPPPASPTTGQTIPSIAAPQPPSAPVSVTNDKSTPPSTSDLAAQLQASIDKLISLLNQTVSKAQQTDLTSNPHDVLRDRNAYRGEIRALIAQNDLDDRHDSHGNALFRFNFTATVFPGPKLDKWGMVDVQVEPPTLSRNDIESLYLAWLAHATYRANTTYAATTSGTLPDRTFDLLSAGSGPLAFARYRFTRNSYTPKDASTPATGNLSTLGGDPCWYVQTEREAAALDCDTLQIAVPPTFQDMAEQPFIHFTDIVLKAVVEAISDSARIVNHPKQDSKDNSKGSVLSLDDSRAACPTAGFGFQFTSLDSKVTPKKIPANYEDFTNMVFDIATDVEAKKPQNELKGALVKAIGDLAAADKSLMDHALAKEKADKAAATGDAAADVANARNAEDAFDKSKTDDLKAIGAFLFASSALQKKTKSNELPDGTLKAIKTHNFNISKIDKTLVIPDPADAKDSAPESKDTSRQQLPPLKQQLLPLKASVMNMKLFFDVGAKPSATPGLAGAWANAAKASLSDTLKQWNDAVAQLSAPDLLAELAPYYSREYLLANAQRLVELAPAIAAASDGISGRREMSPALQSLVVDIIAQLDEHLADAREFLRLVAEANSDMTDCPWLDAERLRKVGREKVPLSFLTPLFGRAQAQNIFNICFAPTNNNGSTCTGFEPSGTSQRNVYVYATQPLESAQRISTIADAASAYQLALSLTGAMPNIGVFASTSFGLMQEAVGKAQGLERVPLVVSYANHGNDAEVIKSGHFGWVLGPKARIDAANKTLVLEQGVTTYQVTADLSVPAWWHKVDLQVLTNWIGNWRDGKLWPRPDEQSKRTIHVDLPLNSADLDSLTNFLAEQLTGERIDRTRILSVDPVALSACSTSPVSVQVYGINVWRSTAAALGGVSAPDGAITILPDMQGVAVNFPASAIQTLSSKAGGKANLTIWTRNGYDSFPVTITGSGAPCTDPVSSTAAATPNASIKFIAPSTISACDDDATFLVSTSGMKGATIASLGSVAGSGIVQHRATTSADGTAPSGSNALTVYQVKFSGLRRSNLGLSAAQLTLSSLDGTTATGTVNITRPLNCTSPASSIAAVPKVMTVAGSVSLDVCVNRASLLVYGPGADQVTTASLFGVSTTPRIVDKTVPSMQLDFGNLPVFTSTTLPSAPVEVELTQGTVVNKVALTPICSAKSTTSSTSTGGGGQ